MELKETKKLGWTQGIAIALGPMLFALIVWGQLFVREIEGRPDLSLTPAANLVLAVAVWMLTWWITESVPLAVTALLPMLLFPLLQIMPQEQAAAPYGDPVVYLFFGGFVLALGLETHGLHKRIALAIIRWTGFSPPRLVLGFMLATALLSMWISNTATAVMMLPMAVSVLNLMNQDPANRVDSRFAAALVLAIAYGANIGGMATLIGTPPNLVMAGYFRKELGIEISFMAWFTVAMPVVIVLLFVTYWLLVSWLFPCRKIQLPAVEQIFATERARLGIMGRAELSMLVVFVVTASLWVLRGTIVSFFPGLALSDTSIALLATIALFVIPAQTRPFRPLLTWEATARLPWGILLLFGGGLCLAEAFRVTGVIVTLGNMFASIGGGNFWLTVILLTGAALYLTEVMSNVALVTVFIPVICGIATQMDLNPLTLAMPATLAASCAFMFPMATPPNAIVFASGQISIRQMAVAGFWLNLASITVIVILTQILIPWAI